jgi:FKBP-type peptidyl-prolyl cis-trans isomerase FkpA
VIRTAAFLVVSALAAAGCGSSPTAPTSSPPYSQTDLRIGTGAEIASGQIARVFYTGWIYDPARPDSKGLRFDSNVGTDFPLHFEVGAAQVIEGWDRGIPGMRVGGQRRLIIPPSLGYGMIRNGPIPPFSTLLFEVELTAILEPETPSSDL